MFRVLFLVILVIVALNIRKAGFMKKRYTLILTILSVAWWVFLVIDQLRLKLNCTPDDGFCNSGNTFSGDLMWGSIIAMYTLLFIWIPFTLITYVVVNRKNTKPKPSKVKS